MHHDYSLSNGENTNLERHIKNIFLVKLFLMIFCTLLNRNIIEITAVNSRNRGGKIINVEDHRAEN